MSRVTLVLLNGTLNMMDEGDRIRDLPVAVSTGSCIPDCLGPTAPRLDRRVLVQKANTRPATDFFTHYGYHSRSQI
jgi:hypothetical protein